MKLCQCQYIDAEPDDDHGECMAEGCTKEAKINIGSATDYYSDVYLCREHAIEFRDELNSAIDNCKEP